MIDPIETNEIYLRADIDLRSESGKIKQMVVMIDCSTLKSVIPPLRPPVISSDTPKFLQQITNNLVTIKHDDYDTITDYLVGNTCPKHKRKDTYLQKDSERFTASLHC